MKYQNLAAALSTGFIIRVNLPPLVDKRAAVKALVVHQGESRDCRL